MSTLFLSILLLVLIVAGMMVARPIREHFASGAKPIEVSPALLNLIATPALTKKPESVQVDPLAREQDLNHPKCPKCECPDMSQYIRLDEIPCWNCSLP